MRDLPQTVVETAGYLRNAAAFFSEEELAGIAAHIGGNPEAGSIVPQTGGIRKIRWGVKGRGKRGGVRVIYYFHNETIPVFLLDVFAKNEKANLSKAERNELRRIAAELAKYGGSK